MDTENSYFGQFPEKAEWKIYLCGLSVIIGLVFTQLQESQVLMISVNEATTGVYVWCSNTTTCIRSAPACESDNEL